MPGCLPTQPKRGADAILAEREEEGMSRCHSKKAKRLPVDQQRGFSFEGELGPVRAPAPGGFSSGPLARFDEGDRYLIWIGNMPLEKYLAARGLQRVIDLQTAVAQLDLRPLMKAYKFGGRRPFHPGSMLGLVIYGMLVRRWSLRELELLAQTDVCAWWMTGGVQPDHSTIGKFVTMHAEILTEDFFLSVSKHVVKALGLARDDAAFDGTIVESAASHFKTLKREAAEVAATKAVAKTKDEPDNPKAHAQAETATKVVQALAERSENREVAGKSGDQVQIAPSDFEAVVQPLKNGVARPAYKPSIIATKERIIVGQVLEPSSETAAVKPLLQQYRTLFRADPLTAMMDAGYHRGSLLKDLADAEINTLCPAGKAKGDDDFVKMQGKHFAKSAFVYEEAIDRYRCPAGQLLAPLTHVERDALGRVYRRHQTPACAQCPIRGQCTDSAKGRSVKRYTDDEYKDAMNKVFEQPAAREHYRYRQAMVEPVFAELRERQGLKRFHRRGRIRVAAEFALHCIAYNLKRKVALAAAALAAAAAAASAASPVALLLFAAWRSLSGRPRRRTRVLTLHLSPRTDSAHASPAPLAAAA